MKGIIYKYTSPIGKHYIGQTINEKKRKIRFKSSKSYAGIKIDLARAEFGVDNFKYEVLEIVEHTDNTYFKILLNQREWHYIEMYDAIENGYNSMTEFNGINKLSLDDYKIFTETDEFKELYREKLESIKDGIRNGIDLYNYAVDNNKLSGFVPSNDFKAYTLFKDGRYVINEQAFLDDKYFILGIIRQYTKGFDIKGSLENVTEVKQLELPKSTTYKELVEFFNTNNKDEVIDWGIYSTKTDWIQIIETSYRLYKRTWMDITYAKQMIDNYSENSNLLNNEIRNLFVTGKSYTRKEVKETLQKLYDANNLKRKAKHTDLDEVMTVRHKKVKGERFIEIINK